MTTVSTLGAEPIGAPHALCTSFWSVKMIMWWPGAPYPSAGSCRPPVICTLPTPGLDYALAVHWRLVLRSSGLAGAHALLITLPSAHAAHNKQLCLPFVTPCLQDSLGRGIFRGYFYLVYFKIFAILIAGIYENTLHVFHRGSRVREPVSHHWLCRSEPLSPMRSAWLLHATGPFCVSSLVSQNSPF